MKTEKLIQLLQSCWLDPSANSEVAEQYRKRQFIAVLKLVPLASFATYAIIIITYFGALTILEYQIFIIWACSLTAIASSNLILWQLFIFRHRWDKYARFSHYLLTFNLAAAALLYALLAIQVFVTLDEPQRTILIAIIAAFTATGCWMFASMPLAGILWCLLLAGAFGVGNLLSTAPFPLLAYLAIFYSVFLCATVLVTSHKFIRGLIAETEIEQQRELIGLLLHDFEANTNDWLWELDNQGYLRHVSVQLVKMTGKTEEQLKAQAVPDIFRELGNPDTQESNITIEKLLNALRQAQPFNDLRVAVTIDKQRQWWSLKGRPLFDEQKRIRGWRGVTSDITAAYTRELEMTRLAKVDSLTDLSNRHHFLDVLNQLVPNNTSYTPCYLMMLDLDNFKMINDSLGHHAGDQLLIHLAQKLTNILPSDAVLARLGGDEFAIIMQTNLSKDSAQQFAEHVKESVAIPFILQEHKIEMKVSIGISFAPDDASNAIDLLKASDMALYNAKEEGRNRISFFTQELYQRALYKQKLLIDLKSAIAEQQFFLLYQPQVDIHKQQLIGFEALVRWQHPTEGLVPPDDFIPLAESSKLIVELGEWVLQQACRDAVQWPKHLRVAVNVSGVQCEQTGLLDVINKALTDSGLMQDRLEIELTESALMHNNSELLNILTTFRQGGGSVAIDDFGTGFSSFSYLHTFPLDKLKIDRSFVQLLSQPKDNSKAQAIIRSIIQLAKSLDLIVTAEGIETDEQQLQLTALACDLGQGYLMSKPMNAARVKHYIAEFSS